MKMGNRKLKRLDKLGVQSQNKTRLDGIPKNRAEKRRLKHLLRRADERLPPEDEAILFSQDVALVETAIRNGAVGSPPVGKL